MGCMDELGLSSPDDLPRRGGVGGRVLSSLAMVPPGLPSAPAFVSSTQLALRRHGLCTWTVISCRDLHVRNRGTSCRSNCRTANTESRFVSGPSSAEHSVLHRAWDVSVR